MEGGRAAIAKAFRQEGLEATEKLLEGALKPLKQAGLAELYTAVGSGSRPTSRIEPSAPCRRSSAAQ